MIMLTRREAHSLRAVFRRSVLGVAHRGPLPPVLLRVTGARLCVEHRYAALGVRHTMRSVDGPPETIPLPLEALADVEGHDLSTVAVEAAGPERTVVRWEDRGIPQRQEYAVPAAGSLVVLPEPPPDGSPCSADLLDALAEACRTCGDSDRRYALGCVQLRGRAGEVVATDGHQVLVQRGYRFPWDEDLLVRHTPLLACQMLLRDRPLSLGRTDGHVVLSVGAWTVYLEVQTDARFPHVEHVLPAESSEVSRVHIDPADAAYLVQAIDRLPGADKNNAPVTLELNGGVAVRARDPERGGATELVLTRSRPTGVPVRISTNRVFLTRALRLGFSELLVASAEAPVWCRDGRRVYAWQPLDRESVIDPADDVVRIESSAGHPATGAGGERSVKAGNPVTDQTERAASRATNQPVSASVPLADRMTNGAAVNDRSGPTGLTVLIREAQTLHENLAGAKARAARLTAALRQMKKRDRLVASTLSALKELKLQDVSA